MTPGGGTPDDQLAAWLAGQAGELLLELRASGAADLGGAGDRAAHELLVAQLGARRPADRLLSEEAHDREPGTGVGRVWIIDPLDGTREYAELDREDWAVHVALVVDGVAEIGAVALPARGLVLSTAAALPAPAPAAIRPRVLVSRSRPAPQAERLAAALGGDLVPMGSAGAKAMAVVLGEGDVYAHSGGQYEWDSAAPAAVARAAGLHVSRLDGSPLRHDGADPWLPDLLICRPELAAQVIAAVASV